MPLQISVGPGTYTQSQLRAIAPDFQISWPANAISVRIGPASRIDGFNYGAAATVGTYDRPVPPKPTATPPPPVRTDTLGNDMARINNTAQLAAQQAVARAAAANAPPPITDRPYTPPQPTITPPRIATPTPPPTDTARVPPLPNLVQNQAAVNQALTKLAQADILLQRAQQLGMNVAEISKQISELRQLLQNAQTHLMT